MITGEPYPCDVKKDKKKDGELQKVVKRRKVTSLYLGGNSRNGFNNKAFKEGDLGCRRRRRQQGVIAVEFYSKHKLKKC